MATGTYVTVPDLKERLGLGQTDTADDTLLGKITDEVNAWIESYTGRVLAPIASAVYQFDGDDLIDSVTLDLGRYGARAVTLLETTDETGGTYTTTTDYILRPLAHQRSLQGEPARWLILTEGSFSNVYGSVRVTMTAGFDAVPDDVRSIAIAVATRWWHGRQTGLPNIVGSDETGELVVGHAVPTEFKRTLDRYRRFVVA